MLSMHFKPQEGEMMIFPAWLRHAVTPNESTQDRISIAFNFDINKLVANSVMIRGNQKNFTIRYDL